MKMNEFTRTIFSLLVLLCCMFSYSQGLKVRDFKPNINDGSAFNAPKDKMGNVCGLIKVRIDSENLRFSGNIIGSPENRINEYWVYMESGSKELIIKHPNFMPLIINIQDYGIDEIESKTTYVLSLGELKYNKEKCGLITTISPQTARLYVDDNLIDNINGDGLYQMYLPKGDHLCRIEQEGYRPMVQAVNIGKQTQHLNITLESILAELEVRCKTENAEIYLDKEFKGNGSWKGTILPGNHFVEARLNNYKSKSQSISLSENDSRSVIISELEREMGKLRIETYPTKLPVLIDHKNVGVSPCSIDIETGTHIVQCSAFGCKSYRSEYTVESDKLNVLKVKLNISNEKKALYESAYEGKTDSIVKIVTDLLISIQHNGYADPKEVSNEIIFWMERSSDPNEMILSAINHNAMISGSWGDKYDFLTACDMTGNPEKALDFYKEKKIIFDDEESNIWMADLSIAFFENKKPEKGFECLKEAGNQAHDVYEALGDYYKEIGDKAKAVYYYKEYVKTHDSQYSYEARKVVKKLEEMGY